MTSYQQQSHPPAPTDEALTKEPVPSPPSNPVEGITHAESLVGLASSYPIGTSLRLVEEWLGDGEQSSEKAEELRTARCHDVLIFRCLLDAPADAPIASTLERILFKALFRVPSSLAGMLQLIGAELHRLRSNREQFQRITAIVAGTQVILHFITR